MDTCECADLTTATEKDSKLLGLLNSQLILKELLMSQSLPWKQDGGKKYRHVYKRLM